MAALRTNFRSETSNTHFGEEMSWDCSSCGNKNEEASLFCEKCDLSKETAMVVVPIKRRKMCQECGHIHREDVYCHVYVEAADDDGADDYISESESESESGSDDSDELSLGIPKVAVTTTSGKQQKMRPIPTPKFVRNMGYIRCNCNIGVPSESKMFEPIQRYVYVGSLQIQTYAELNFPSEKARFDQTYAEKYPESQAKRREIQRISDIAMNLPHILSYLPLGSCSKVPQVSTYWNYGTSLYQQYIDMRNCVPWQAFRAHSTQVDSVLVCGKFVYSGGDRRVLCSDLASATVTSTITRDSGNIPFLFEKDAELFICSTNGSIRSYTLTHTGQNIKMSTTMWEHSRSISHVIPGLRSPGICPMHGIDKHICTLYTSSEDRTVKMWNITKYKAIRNIASKSIRGASFVRIAQSDRHLFVGTTAASIAIFCKEPRCERDDVHSCNIRGNDQAYCLQISLKLPPVQLKSGAPTAVSGLLCVDTTFPFSHLWAGDTSGQLTVWHLPETGLGFIPAFTVKAHNGAINNLVHTYRHAITASDDGFISFYDLFNFDRVRTIDVMEWCLYRNLLQRPDIQRKIKAVHLQEDSVNGGNLVLGTSYGDVVMLKLGTTV